MTSSESPTHPDAPRAGGETPAIDRQATLEALEVAASVLNELAQELGGSSPAQYRADVKHIQALRSALPALLDRPAPSRETSPYWHRDWWKPSLLERHRDGERAEWHRRMSDEHCGTDEIVGYGPYHAEMLSDEALFLELGEEIFTVYFDKKKPCLNDGRAHRKGVLQMRYEETRARSAPPSPERASK